MYEAQSLTNEAEHVAVFQQLIQATRVAQIIHAAAELALPDLIEGGSRSIEALAEATCTHEPSLRRLMRALAAVGVVMLEADGRFALTPLGATLRSAAPDHVRLQARVQLSEPRWRPWGCLVDSIRTGEAAFKQVFGVSDWEYGATNPRFGGLFDEWMSAMSQRHMEAILAAYDFSRFETLIDVGGGHGHLLEAILRATPGLRGVLFDQQHVIQRAVEGLTEAGTTGRYGAVGGSFFDAVPRGGDAYLLKSIIHDWDDQHALAILRNVSAALPSGGTLLLIEQVLPERYVLEISQAIADLNMLVLEQGQERTRAEFSALFAAAGLGLTRVLPTDSEMSILEGKHLVSAF